MNEAISYCAQVTDLPESVTSLRDKESTHLSPSLPHAVLSSPSWIKEGLWQLPGAKEKNRKTKRETVEKTTQF